MAWDMQSGACTRTLKSFSVLAHCATVVGDCILQGCDDGVIRARKLCDGAPAREYVGHEDRISSVWVTKTHLCSGSFDDSVRVFKLETGECQHTLYEHEARVLAVNGVDRQPEVFWSGGDDERVRVWDLETGACLRTFEGHTAEVTVLCPLAPHMMVSGSADRTALVWDSRKETSISRIVPKADRITAMCMVSNGVLALGTGSKPVTFWNLQAGAAYSRLPEQGHHTDWVTSLCAYTGAYLFTGGADRSVKLWDWARGARLRELQPEHQDWVVHMSLRKLSV